jgi:hypothetical protein
MASLSQKVELHISCRKLKNFDTFSKSDPQVRLFEFASNNKWVQIGQTETIKNNLNPNFEKVIVVTYNFEKHQKIKFEVVDDDGGNDFDFIGRLETSMGNIMGAKEQVTDAQLTNDKKATNLGRIIVRAEALASSNVEVTYQLSG